MKDALLMAKLCELAYIKKGDGSPNVPLIRAKLTEIDRKFKRVYGFNKSSSQAIIVEHDNFVAVAFRGTDELSDWLDNANIKTVPQAFGEFHAGFWWAVQDIYADIKKVLNGMGQKPLYLTGHSLGGAMAQVFTARMLYNLNSVNGVYTFGQPRCMTKRTARIFNKFMKDQTFRYQNSSDIITRMPSMLFGFSHAGTHYYINTNGKIKEKPGFLYKLGDMVRDIFTSTIKPGVEFLEDHNIHTYIAALK